MYIIRTYIHAPAGTKAINIHTYMHICSSSVVFWLPRHARAAGLINTYILQHLTGGCSVCLSSLVRKSASLPPQTARARKATPARTAGDLALQLRHAVDTHRAPPTTQRPPLPVKALLQRINKRVLQHACTSRLMFITGEVKKGGECRRTQCR